MSSQSSFPYAPPSPPPPPPPPPPLSSLRPVVTSNPVKDGMPGSNNGNTKLIPFLGSLERLQQICEQEKKWLLVVIYPSDASYPPVPLEAPEHIGSAVRLWRRQESSSDATKYVAFYPADKLPHVALLDPRTGERLLVWTSEEDNAFVVPFSTSGPSSLSPQFWNDIVEGVSAFILDHSLDPFALGPVHLSEKPRIVSTRRVTEPHSNRTANLPPTSVMDDENAAIAAAIAASLKDIESPSDSGDVDMSDNDDVDEDDDFAFSSSESPETLSEAGLSIPSVSTAASIASNELASPALHEGFKAIPTPSKLVSITPRDSTQLGSSLESLSSSYLERMESCLRASKDPQLLEARRLRQEQDAELREALESDRAREAAEHKIVMRERERSMMIETARAQLPPEPCVGTGVCIALRLPNGQRLTRRFGQNDKLAAVRDLVIVVTEGALKRANNNSVQSVLRSPGLTLDECSWETTLNGAKVGKQAAFFVHSAVLNHDA